MLSYNYPGNPWYQASWNELVSVKAVQGQPSDSAATGRRGFLDRTLDWVF